MRFVTTATTLALVITASLLALALKSFAWHDSPEPAQARLLFVGDLMMGRYVGASLEKAGYDSAFEGVKSFLSSADLTIGNLESPLVSASSSSPPVPSPNQPLLTGSGMAAPALAAAGFDVLSLANNHSLDAQEAGLDATEHFLTSAGVEPVGLEKDGRVQTVVREVHGLRLAFLACTLIAPNRLAPPTASIKPFYVNPASESDLQRLASELKHARLGADLVVLVMHWGTEYAAVPDDSQKRIAALASDAGADIVVGAHPHVAQGMELLNSPGRATLAAYSLGNALFDQNSLPETTEGLALEATVDREGVVFARLVPLKIDSEGGGYSMALAGNETGQDTLKRAALSTPKQLQWQTIWNAAIKPGIALAYRRTPVPASSLEDLGMDSPSRVELNNGTLSVSGIAGGKSVHWSTEPGWRVTGYTVGDADGDGRPEIVYTLWKPRLVWTRPDSGGMEVNQQGGEVLPHVYINGWRKASETSSEGSGQEQWAMRPVWHGSPRPAPVLSVAVAPVGRGGKPLLATLDSSDPKIEKAPGTLRLWEWTGGFGYELADAVSGLYSELWSDGRQILFR